MWKYSMLPPCTRICVGDKYGTSLVTRIMNWDIFYCNYPDRFLVFDSSGCIIPPWFIVFRVCEECKYQDVHYKGKTYTKEISNEMEVSQMRQ